MPYFSRLTDIVTCNLTSILEKAEDPEKALAEIIHEMREGVAGADRSVTTAIRDVANIESDINDQRQQSEQWLAEAEKALKSDDDVAARNAVQRKQEVEDLIAGLEHQLTAAISNRNHLSTMRNALQARLSDAQRRMQADDVETTPTTDSQAAIEVSVESERSRVDDELEALRKRLEN